jgi:hypothetical protein
MVITIDTDELESEFVESWKMGFIRDPHIDYATNCIHAWFENKEVILYRFKGYGWINDNRENKYYISAGRAGIMIKITKTI